MKETSCFAAMFKLFALLLLNFDEFQKFFRFFSENFQKIFRIFSEISEKILKKIWNISEKLCIQKFSAANHSKMKETSCFAAIFILFALLFSNFDEFQNFFRIFSENFQKIFRFFSEISENFLTEKFLKFSENFYKISEKILIYFWKIYESRNFLLPTIQKWRKLAVLLLFSSCVCYFHTFCVAFLEFWRISEIFQIFFRKFSEFFQIFFRNFWKFSEQFLKNFWNISEKFLKYFWKIYESRDFLLPTIQKWRKLAVFKVFS